MNAFVHASTMLDSPPRYIPGYPALSSPKLTQPIELNWSQNESSRPTSPFPHTPTAHSGGNNVLFTTKPISTSLTTTTTTSPLSFGINNSDNDPGETRDTLPLVEHANRAEIHRRQKRVESETSEALKGDIEWVRSGGILRDGDGRRDFARTERIREQLDEQERERKALAVWMGYEDRWRASLVTGRGRTGSSPLDSADDQDRDQGMRFRDVAWPVAKPPESPDELTVGTVREFVLSPLRRKDISPSKRKDRIRQLLLRYHPDKTAFLLSRVAEEEKERVREGVNNVFMSLKSLQGDPDSK